MEVHREPKGTSSIPWFLNEIRTRLFACVYHDDKFLSNILGKSPRVPKHYCNRRPPLNVSDEEVLGTELTLEKALCGLDSEGWNMQEFRPSDWVRVRYILGTFREEILSIELAPQDQRHENFIRQVSDP